MGDNNTYEIVTSGGMRWDTIAQNAYGNHDQFEDIVRANPSLAQYDLIPDGMVVVIPVKENIEVSIDDNSLPPWKR